MNKLTAEREKAITNISSICKEIGCSGMGKECKTHPHLCGIIWKIIAPKGIANLRSKDE